MTTPDEMKDKIVEWCKEDNLSCTVVDNHNSNHHWEINVHDVAVYCQKKYPDRVYFQQIYNLTEKQKELMNGLDKQKKANLINNLMINSVSFDYHQSLLNEQDGKVLTGIMLYKFGSIDLTKIEFLNLYLRVRQIGNLINNLLANTIGVEMNLKKMQEKSASDSTNIGIG